MWTTREREEDKTSLLRVTRRKKNVEQHVAGHAIVVGRDTRGQYGRAHRGERQWLGTGTSAGMKGNNAGGAEHSVMRIASTLNGASGTR